MKALQFSLRSRCNECSDDLTRAGMAGADGRTDIPSLQLLNLLSISPPLKHMTDPHPHTFQYCPLVLAFQGGLSLSLSTPLPNVSHFSPSSISSFSFFNVLLIPKGRGSSVSTATWIQAGVPIPERTTDFSLHHGVKKGSGATQWVPGCFSVGGVARKWSLPLTYIWCRG